MSEAGSGCVEPAKGPLAKALETAEASRDVSASPFIRARVGQLAPDFEASAFVDGGFKNI